MRTLYLIDANSIVHRCYHALPPLTTKDGKPGQALYGLSSVLIKLFRESRPDYAAALFDRPEPTFRKERYAEYKATRAKTADELVAQLIVAPQVFENFGIKTFSSPGFEADDLIATLAERFSKTPDLQVVILTGDMDTLQLVEDDHIVVRSFLRGISETTLYNEPAVKERYGLPPKSLPDYKAFVGDTSDNVPGVPGFGPKAARTLLETYGSLEGIFTAAKKKGADNTLLLRAAEHEQEAEFSKNLVVLRKDAPIEPALDELRAGRPNDHVGEYLTTLGFASLAKRLNGGADALPSAKKKPKKKEVSPAAPQGSMF